MKYEPIFGNQSLFDGAPEDAEMAAGFCQQFIRYYMVFGGKLLFCDSKEGSWQASDNNFPTTIVVAMRRIIHTPTWSKADQMAGKLPEIGAKFSARGFTWECLRHLGVYILAVTEDSFHGFLIDECDPLETDAERQQREREEWCNNAAKLLKNLEYSSTLTSIYDALLSGTLSVPTKGGE